MLVNIDLYCMDKKNNKYLVVCSTEEIKSFRFRTKIEQVHFSAKLFLKVTGLVLVVIGVICYNSKCYSDLQKLKIDTVCKH